MQPDGKRYHGDVDHQFKVWLPYEEDRHGRELTVSAWSARSDTFVPADQFCGCCEYRAHKRHEYMVYECLGHEPGGMAEAEEAGEQPAGGVPAREEVEPMAVPAAPVDRWDFDAGVGAWIRTHEVERYTLFVPTTLFAGTPELDSLGDAAEVKRRFKDGTEEVERYAWRDPLLESGTADPWTGRTLFFLKGGDPEVIGAPVRRRLRAKEEAGAPASGSDQVPKELQEVIVHEGVDHPGLSQLLSASGIERAKLIQAQRACRDCAVYQLAALCRYAERDVRQALVRFRKQAPELWPEKLKLDTVLRKAEKFEVVEGVLYRLVYDAKDGEIQRRCCVPTGRWGMFEFPGRGQKPLGFRERLLLHYHNSDVGGHPGRERTCEMLERDWWWPGMFEDVRRWCARCEVCAMEQGVSGVSTWARTEFYSRPFQVLQFDLISCRDPTDPGPAKYVLTVICCFSRWCWLIPIGRDTSENIANALLYRVFLNLAMFPTVLRSDNGSPFVSEAVARLNKTLEIKHVLGSVYHPQSQGMVERMHKTVNAVVRKILDEHKQDWEQRLPFAEAILRMSPMAVLGGRSPYEVVTGIRPKLPAALDMASSVQAISVDEYSISLVKCFQEMYADIQRAQEREVEKRENTLKGHISAELQVGDVVLVKRTPDSKSEVPRRFQSKTYPLLCRAKKKINVSTAVLEDLADPRAVLPFNERQHAERLVRVELPALALASGQPRMLETANADADTWTRWRIERFAVDGRVKLACQEEGQEGRVEWRDLSTTRYRWVQ